MQKTGEFQRIVLKNGLRIILVPQPNSPATTIMTLVEAGSKYETKDINGLSHFLEHMCFKGTAKRPRAIDIAGELDGLGAEYNAFTTQEYTSYYAKVKNESSDHALEVVADLYLHPTFDPKEIEKEKGVIIEELNMYEDIPQRRVQELFMELVYGDQPAGWGVGGRKDVIRKLTREDFLNYRGKHYLAQATTLVIAGGFTQKNIVEKISRHFETIDRGVKGKKIKVKESQRAPQELVKFKESDQTHLVLGFRAFSMFDKRRYALQVLADILGGGMSSRLFQSVREELGAAYYVNAAPDLYSDHGTLMMTAGVEHTKLELVMKTMLKECGRLRDEIIDTKTLARAKDHLMGRLLLSVETSDEIGYFYGGQEVMGLPLRTPHTLTQAIKKVTAQEIKAVARTLFKNDRMNCALIGPFQKKSFRSILKV